MPRASGHPVRFTITGEWMRTANSKNKNSLFENRSTEKQSCVATGDESQHIVLQRCGRKSQAASDNQNSNTG